MTSETYWFVHVTPQTQALDPHGNERLHDIQAVPTFKHIASVRSSTLYFLQGNLCQADVKRIATELLADPVTETCHCGSGLIDRNHDEIAVEVHYLPGVMDPVALSTTQAIHDLLSGNGSEIKQVRTARRYIIEGVSSLDELARIAHDVLANDCIQKAFIQGFDHHDILPDEFPVAPPADMTLQTIPILGLNEEELAKLSREAHLFLSVEEMQTIQNYFAKRDREPTDIELETLAQTWSEHCVHKTLKSKVVYKGQGFGTHDEVEVQFDNLLKDTIAKATSELNRDWCLSVFHDNAGIVEFDDDYGVAFKVETHNHPSAIEPYGGAATGIGGVIRDILGVGLGAKPIANTDVFCFAPLDYPDDRLPKGVLHPRRVHKGVISGVRDYGNRMGIPTINGAIYFDKDYLANPLVFCGCAGIIPKNQIQKEAKPGDLIVVTGGKTGRDGIHGATFSSAELTDTHADEFSHAVQIGNAIEEKKVLDALLRARDHKDGCLFNAVTDCGAGGLSSAVGEMGETLGADVNLDTVPLKYEGLRYDEIWISEAQERMVFAVPSEKLETFLKIFADEHVEATVIGTFPGDGKLKVNYNGTLMGELEMKFLHEGIPNTARQATWAVRPDPDQEFFDGNNIIETLLGKLSEPNIASKEWTIHQYDHEVQGGSAIKPLMGIGKGPTDAAVTRPRIDSFRGIALGNGLCPQRSKDDPYWMAIAAADEAIRNVICVGADPEHISILDNFCWGTVEDAETMGGLVRACVGAKDAAIAFGTPFISGKDSLNNQFSQSAEEAERCSLPERIVIPGTLLISAMGIVQDVRKCVSSDLKKPGSQLICASVPANEVGLEEAATLHRTVAKWIQDGLVLSAHDVSDGGLAVAIAEMCIAGNLGAEVELDDASDAWFLEFLTTYVLEVAPETADKLLADDPESYFLLGHVIPTPELKIEGESVSIEALSSAWRQMAISL